MNPHSRSVYTIIILSLFVCKVAWFKSQYKYCIQYRRLQLVEALFLSNASEPMTDLVLGRLVGIQGWDCRVVAPSNWHIDLDCRALLQAETTIQDKDKAVGTQFERNISNKQSFELSQTKAWRIVNPLSWQCLVCFRACSWNCSVMNLAMPGQDELKQFIVDYHYDLQWHWIDDNEAKTSCQITFQSRSASQQGGHPHVHIGLV